ncbi:MAG: DEAD/DEAH box helicase [Candidatus Aminicenantes bacterium]|uniref:Putative helicase n=1 Tax=Candidatus Saccharicenans subterraneus TaxID=2508984 RepID=A0A3E2BPZ7_9BACT|nr:DEAD/DEAH box helicase [Candidatus Aminicenantes bacterium]RFT16789.1 MAG: putative helicase [Candidatus Saccharicenans subterraneum]
MSIGIKPGDRVLVRDRPWVVREVSAPYGTQAILKLQATDEAVPSDLTIIYPPEEISILPTQEVEFDLRGLDSFAAWAMAHRILGATFIKETGILTGVRYGRVNLEAYQLAPALRILSKVRPSLLIADDVGLGKTIEAGLALLELTARGRAKRVLVVAPPGLMDQWHDELLDKFGLEFTIIGNASELAAVQTRLPAGVSPWDALPRVITSLDYIKKETVRNRALRKRWDLVIVDEAHALAEAGTPENPYRTQRTRLGLALRDCSRGLLLLTATPHNGYSHSFRSLLELVEPTLATFHGSPADLNRRMEAARIRRMKAQIVRRLPDGSEAPLFPKRHVLGIPVTGLSDQEKEFLNRVAAYCSRTARQAEQTEEAELIGFAMQVIKKRALSSRAALSKTLEYRLEALRQEQLREEPPSRAEIRDLRADLPLSEATAERTAIKVIRSAIPKEERRRKAEISAINGIKRLLARLPVTDPKIEALIKELKSVFSKYPEEKVIVFTEYRDTLAAIQSRFDKDPDLANRYVLFHGGLTRRQRLAREAIFERPETRALLATDAASEGLNLQRFCRRVIHFELPWNPNRLEQRNGRVDRYGQTRNPVIRYLFYPDSPEDDVLDKLVQKIEEMARQQISTPDTLGVYADRADIREKLVELDPESPDIETHKRQLIHLFEDRTAEFIKNAGQLLTLSQAQSWEEERIGRLLCSSEPLLPDDREFEEIIITMLGPQAVKPDSTRAGVFRIEVPLHFRGENVRPVYPAATFRRSIATLYRTDEVEYITPLHPLAQAMARQARSRLLQVYSASRGLTPRRLAARTISSNEPPSVIFTFYGTIRDKEGGVEEHLLAVQVGTDGEILGDPVGNLRYLSLTDSIEDVHPKKIESLFASRFDALRDLARQEASRWLTARASDLHQERKRLAEKMLLELELDTADRISEIEEEEKRARRVIEETGQQRIIFEKEDQESRSFAARKSMVETFKKQRQQEIENFTRIQDPSPPQPLGALFLVPSGGGR